MARSRNNVITHTYSGKFGNVCMQHDGIIRSLPAKATRNWSAEQQKHLSRFEMAKEYARQVVADPERTAHYAVYLKRWKRKLRNTGIYQLAIMDFMHSPGICDVTLRQDAEGKRSLSCRTSIVHASYCPCILHLL